MKDFRATFNRNLKEKNILKQCTASSNDKNTDEDTVKLQMSDNNFFPL